MSEAQNPFDNPIPEPTNSANETQSNDIKSVGDLGAQEEPNQPEISFVIQKQGAAKSNTPEAVISEETPATKAIPEEQPRISFIGDAGGLRFDISRESSKETAEVDQTNLFEINLEVIQAFQPVNTTSEDYSSSSESTETAESNNESAAIAEISKAETGDFDVLELVHLSEALQQQNNDLLAHVQDVERLLDECNRALESQIKRSQTAETKLAEQSKELNTTQEQLGRLFRELEASHQVAQRQQILIETLNHQLESSQERVAELERQCAFIQQRYNEQSQLLLQTENTRQELQDRLQRQQRYTLQFKAALDKCLDIPTIKEINAEISALLNSSENQTNPQNISEAVQLLLKPQPIKPWSSVPQIITEPSNITQEESSRNLILPQFNKPQPQLEPSSESLSNPFLEIAKSDPYLAADRSKESTDNPPANFAADEEAMWEELERLTQGTTVNVTPQETSVIPKHSNSWPANTEESAVKEVELLSVTPTTEPNLAAAKNDESVDSKPYPSSPSPIVYPQRTTKKIKSLAAVDLPSFPRPSQTK
jgi:myosin heavy subunit